MVCTKYEYVTGGVKGELQSDTRPSTMPETYEGVTNGPGGGSKIAPGSTMLITGTTEVYIKKEGTGWDKL